MATPGATTLHRLFSACRRALLAAALAVAAAPTLAAPFAITFTGTVASFRFQPEVTGFPLDTALSVTLVMDNGGSSRMGQTWAVADLTCIVWTNYDGSVMIAQDLVANRLTDTAESTTEQ